MWVHTLALDNIRCFRQQKLTFTHNAARRSDALPYRWITLLGENGVGKSTLLQSLALLLAGPDAAKELLPRPEGWVRHASKLGQLDATIHVDEGDATAFTFDRPSKTSYTYSFSITNNAAVDVGQETYPEPVLSEDASPAIRWLRANAYAFGARGWFAAGYGPFRRLTRTNGHFVPSPTLDRLERANNFVTMFDEDRSLDTFERLLVYLDNRIASNPQDDRARTMREAGQAAINRLLPDNTRIADVSPEGQVLFNIDGQRVPSSGLSDGYRSMVALVGDVIWRLLQAYPDLPDLAEASGVVLIDELDIHLHPSWQRQIAGLLQATFPRLQFFVTTQSPLVAIGAGEDACTLRLETFEGETRITSVKDLSAFDADRALLSPAFGLTSTHSPTTDRKIRRYHELREQVVVSDKQLKASEQQEYEQLQVFMRQAQPIGGPPEPGSLEARMQAYLESVLP